MRSTSTKLNTWRPILAVHRGLRWQPGQPFVAPPRNRQERRALASALRAERRYNTRWVRILEKRIKERGRSFRIGVPRD